MRQRLWSLRALGIGMILLGLFLPTVWYDALPGIAGGAALPVRGVVLLKVTFVVEGVILLLVLLWRDSVSAPTTFVAPLAHYQSPAGEWDVHERTAGMLLGAITVLALVLRFIAIDSDLWIDEIAPVIMYRDISPLAVVASYVSPNNHLLNTLLVKLVTGVAGEREWAIRLPSVLFGVLTIPVMYWVSRSVMSRFASLGAALLLAVSYHHVFFSQNARGYASYLFFSLLATGFLVRSLDTDRTRTWVGYVAVMVFDFASLLHGGFVFAGHFVVACGALLQRARGGGTPSGPLIRRAAIAFVVTGFLGLQLYVTMMPQAYVVINRTYASAGAGMPVASRAFATDFISGLSEGFGPGLLLGAIPILAVGALGFLELVRRKWTLAAALVAPLVLLLGLVALRSLAASPRFFLLGLPLAMLAAVLGVSTLSERFVRATGASPSGPRAAWMAGGLLLVAATLSLTSLPAYYRTPKQSYRAAIEYARTSRNPGDLIVPIQNATAGFRFYGAQSGLVEGRDFVVARSLPALDSLRAGGRPLVIVTTLERGLMLETPAFYRRITDGWSEVKRFPATIHEGEIRIWRPRG